MAEYLDNTGLQYYDKKLVDWTKLTFADIQDDFKTIAFKGTYITTEGYNDAKNIQDYDLNLLATTERVRAIDLSFTWDNTYVLRAYKKNNTEFISPLFYINGKSSILVIDVETNIIYLSLVVDNAAIEDEIDAVDKRIALEEARAKTAEGDLTIALNEEIVRATGVEDQLQKDITTEQKRAEKAESDITDSITDLKEDIAERGKEVDEDIADINTAINTINNTIIPEVKTSIVTETNTRIAQDNILQTQITNNDTDIAQLRTDLTTETTNRTTEDVAIATSVTTEVNRATAQEAVLQANINSEATAREEADDDLKALIEQEVEDREGADEDLKEELTEYIDTKTSSLYKMCGSVATVNDLPTDANVGDVYNVLEDGHNYVWTGKEWDRLAGTVDLSDYYTKSEVDSLIDSTEALITAEETARKEQDTYLQQAIDDETSARLTSESTLQANIDAEIVARTAADSTLTNQIASTNIAIETVQSNLDTEITRAQEVEANITSRLDTIESISGVDTTALDQLRTDLTAETTARTNSDTVLQTNIDTLTTTVETNKSDIEASLAETNTAVAANADDIESQGASISALQESVDTINTGITEIVTALGEKQDVLTAGTYMEIVESDDATTINCTLTNATTSAAGLMSAADKTTIDNLSTTYCQIYSQASEPTVSGIALWYDTTNSLLKIYNGSSWIGLNTYY